MTASGRFISVGSCWDGSTNGTASFVDSRNAHGLWKLPEPWTPRTRPPLLAKRADAFRTATTGPLPGDLQSTSVTHVPGLLCCRCSRLHLVLTCRVPARRRTVSDVGNASCVLDLS